MRAFILSVCIALAALSGTSPESKQIGARLEARYRSARTLQATFLERYSENGHQVRMEAGVAYFKRPGKMRWVYESPEKNVFVVDGKTAWFFVPADHTVTRMPAKQSTDWRTPLALLAGEMKLSRVCARVEVTTAEKPSNPGDPVLYCPLRGEENKLKHRTNDATELQDTGAGEAVFLEVAAESGNLARVLIREKAGIDVEFKFTAWRFDPPIADSFFRFEVPSGVAIVNGESPAESKP